MPKTPMTKRGAELLREELHHLKTIERPANSAAIGEARAHGDLSENAEYHAARERAGFIEGRISELEAKLGNAQVIDPRLVDAEGRCVFGATVDVQDENGEASTWQIVGEDEADIKKSRISFSSPMARALIGKESGESVEVQTPGGVKRYEIIDVRYL
jgi:transcription elongation factor GreA